LKYIFFHVIQLLLIIVYLWLWLKMFSDFLCWFIYYFWSTQW